MAIYEPSTPELGKNATGRRIAALRALNAAGGVQYRRYTTGRATYRVETVTGRIRELETKEVAAYITGQSDCYDGFLPHVQEALQGALVDPDVSDQESLVRFVIDRLEERCGKPLHTAAGHFAPEDSEDAPAIA